jgi:hypothetical protein
MGLRYYRRRSLGSGWWTGTSASGPSIGRRGGRISVSAGRSGLRLTVRLLKGLSYVFKR